MLARLPTAPSGFRRGRCPQPPPPGSACLIKAASRQYGIIAHPVYPHGGSAIRAARPVSQLFVLASLVPSLCRFALLRAHAARVWSALALFSRLLCIVVVGLRVRACRHAQSFLGRLRSGCSTLRTFRIFCVVASICRLAQR